MQALEWLELHAIKSGLRPRDDVEIDQMFAARVASAGTGRDENTYRALQAIAEDFKGLRDVSAIARRADELGRDKSVRSALDRERDDDQREMNLMAGMMSLSDRLSSDNRPAVLVQLRQRWSELSAKARNPVDSPERQLARRVMAALSADGTKDEDYAKIIAEYRLGRGGL
jgi:hypothetical protein